MWLRRVIASSIMDFEELLLTTEELLSQFKNDEDVHSLEVPEKLNDARTFMCGLRHVFVDCNGVLSRTNCHFHLGQQSSCKLCAQSPDGGT